MCVLKRNPRLCQLVRTDCDISDHMVDYKKNNGVITVCVAKQLSIKTQIFIDASFPLKINIELRHQWTK